jgi:hypothetical protein
MANPLVGKFFHSTITEPCGCVLAEWQGTVLGHVADDKYLVPTFSWLDGADNVQRLVSIDTMMGWTFYNNADELKWQYEQSYSPRRERHDVTCRRDVPEIPPPGR